MSQSFSAHQIPLLSPFKSQNVYNLWTQSKISYKRCENAFCPPFIRHRTLHNRGALGSVQSFYMLVFDGHPNLWDGQSRDFHFHFTDEESASQWLSHTVENNRHFSRIRLPDLIFTLEIQLHVVFLKGWPMQHQLMTFFWNANSWTPSQN